MHTANHMQQRGFAAAGGANDRNKFPFSNRKAHPVNGNRPIFAVPIFLCYLVNLKNSGSLHGRISLSFIWLFGLELSLKQIWCRHKAGTGTYYTPEIAKDNPKFISHFNIDLTRGTTLTANHTGLCQQRMELKRCKQSCDSAAIWAIAISPSSFCIRDK